MFVHDTESSLRRQNDINNRLWSRNLPSAPLQPYFTPRPVLTKYATLPIVDTPAHVPTVSVPRYPTYSPEAVFNPGTSTAPWSGYASNVHVETELRNQYYALQDCPQNVYIPSSNSDLYRLQWRHSASLPAFAGAHNPHPLLFNDAVTPQTSFAVTPSPQAGWKVFNNQTRPKASGDENEV